MVIEWLQFEVVPTAKAIFIEKDDEIYTSFLKGYPGFLGKEIWVSPREETEVIVVVHWQSKDDWMSVPEADLIVVEKQFSSAVGADNYRLIEVREYQVRKFRQV